MNVIFDGKWAKSNMLRGVNLQRCCFNKPFADNLSGVFPLYTMSTRYTYGLPSDKVQTRL